MSAPVHSEDDRSYAAVLAGLGASPATLRRFLDGHGARAAWTALARGEHPVDPTGRYRDAARRARPDDMALACRRAGVEVAVLGAPTYPRSLATDRDPPGVLFWRGDLGAMDRCPRVAVVGTRAASPRGRDIATAMGAGLARAGAVVVSGLARGIDCAAHRGALLDDADVPVVAVLGTGIDAPMDPQRAALRDAAVRRGVVASEIPPGAARARWWFAVRNRVMAALADVVVVIECHDRGGSLHTVAAARRRGVTVAAVAGGAESSCSMGTNRLIADGAVPVRDAADVLDVVSARGGGAASTSPDRSRRAVAGTDDDARCRPHFDADEAALWQALGDEAVTLETVVRRSGLSIATASAAFERLAVDGLVRDDGGWWRRAPRQGGGGLT